MTQEEFEKGLSELKEAKRCALAGIDYLLDDVQKRTQMVKREMSELTKRQAMIRLERAGLERQRQQVSSVWKDKIKKFLEENQSYASKLEEVSDWCLLRELSRRGFRGTFENESKTEAFMQSANCLLNRVTPPTSSDEQHETTE